MAECTQCSIIVDNHKNTTTKGGEEIKHLLSTALEVNKQFTAKENRLKTEAVLRVCCGAYIRNNFKY